MHSRIALLAASHACIYVACTAPSTQPSPEERAKYTDSMRGIKNGLFISPIVMARTVHFGLQTINFVQLIGIIASAYPYLSPWRVAHSASGSSSTQTHPLFLIGMFMMYAGAALRAMSYYYLGNLFTFDLSVRKDHRLVTGGPYSIVRHPGYTAGILFSYGGALAHLGPGSYWLEMGWWNSLGGIVAGSLYLLWVGLGTRLAFVRMPLEDAVLRQTFADQWDAWAKNCRWKLLPYIY